MQDITFLKIFKDGESNQLDLKSLTLILHWLKSWFAISKVTSYLSFTQKQWVLVGSKDWMYSHIVILTYCAKYSERVQRANLAFGGHPLPLKAGTLKKHLMAWIKKTFWKNTFSKSLWKIHFWELHLWKVHLWKIHLWKIHFGEGPAGLGWGKSSAPHRDTFPFGSSDPVFQLICSDVTVLIVIYQGALNYLLWLLSSNLPFSSTIIFKFESNIYILRSPSLFPACKHVSVLRPHLSDQNGALLWIKSKAAG